MTDLPSDKIEYGPLIRPRFYGPTVQIRPYFIFLIIMVCFQLTMVVLSILDLIPLSPIVLVFLIIALIFESIIIIFGCLVMIKTFAHVSVLWSDELDWDLYENGMLAKIHSTEPISTEVRFIPFKTVSRAFIFPRGRSINEVFELHQDRMRLRDSDRPVNAGPLSREIASTISERVWFVDVNGKLMDLTMVRNNFSKRAMEPFRKLLQEKVKVVE